jgi:hypothetical protein
VYPKYVKNKEFVFNSFKWLHNYRSNYVVLFFFYIFKGEITKDEKHLYN